METKIAEKEAQLPVDDITAEIRAKEKALEYERQRQAALQRRLELDQKLKELTLLRKKLSHLADNCKGNGRPDCPILDELSKLQKKS